MNALRWTLLIIGISIIAGIYLWESAKRKRNLRSRVENLSARHKDASSRIGINPGKEKNIDITSALAAFNAYLKQSRSSTQSPHLSAVRAEAPPPRDDDSEYASEPDFDLGDSPTPAQQMQQKIITIYIAAEPSRRFSGPDILQAIESADMQFGEMNIFHYHGPDKKHATRALFSLANIHEPGYFEIEKMDRFMTSGLVLFMCLPAEIGGDIAFEIMLDTAHNLAYLLGGELRGADRKVIGAESLSTLREIASHF